MQVLIRFIGKTVASMPTFAHVFPVLWKSLSERYDTSLIKNEKSASKCDGAEAIGLMTFLAMCEPSMYSGKGLKGNLAAAFIEGTKPIPKVTIADTTEMNSVSYFESKDALEYTWATGYQSLYRILLMGDDCPVSDIALAIVRSNQDTVFTNSLLVTGFHRNEGGRKSLCQSRADDEQLHYKWWTCWQ